MGLELEGIWLKYFQSIPVTQTRGTHLRPHTCNREAWVWPPSVNHGKGLARAVRALLCGFNGLKDRDLSGGSLWMRDNSLVWRTESWDGSQHTLKKLKVTIPVTVLEGKEVTFHIKQLSATSCPGCFHLSCLIAFSPQSWEVVLGLLEEV